MILDFDTTLEIEVEVEISGFTEGQKETRTDPACGPEIDFLVYVRNHKGEREFLQDSILEKNIDVIYDECIQAIHDRIIDRHDRYMDDKYDSMKDDGRLFHRRSKK